MNEPIADKLQESIRLAFDRLTSFDSSSIASVRESVPADVRERLERFDKIAAVTGRFLPASILGETESEDLRQQTLSNAVARYIVEPAKQGVRWIQSPDVRSALLRGLSRDELKGLLEQALPPTDVYGEALREVLRNGTQVSLDRSVEALTHLKAVADELIEIGLPAPDPAEVRRKLCENAFERKYLPSSDHFVGRDAELRRLRKFLKRRDETPGRWMWEALVLTGLGGAGKSALLARFLEDVHRTGKATLLLFDFDRPGIAACDRVWMNSEASRQIELQLPAAAEALRDRRHESRRAFEERSPSSFGLESFSSESADFARSTDDTLFAIRQALEKTERNLVPLLVVFDTLEQVVGSEKREALRAWIDSLASHLAPTPVNVILSGRLFDGDLKEYRRWSFDEPMELLELPERVATRLLIHSGVEARTANELLRKIRLPRRPLELRLLARMARDYSSIDELRTALETGGSELSAGIVYRRTLQRLGSNVVGALASPGLTLRYVTADLIEQVLVPALDLPELIGDEARKALDQLAEHTWLVTRDDEGRVWHRRDLRRSMLRLMLAEDRATAKRISDHAIARFRDGSADERAEAIYHRLLHIENSEAGAEFELAELAPAYESLQADLDDLPAAGAALLKFAASQKMTAAEIEQLPERYFLQAYEKTGRRLVRNREFGDAERLLRRRRSDGIETGDFREPLLDWEWRTLLASGRWDSSLDKAFPVRFEGGEAERNSERAFFDQLLERPDGRSSLLSAQESARAAALQAKPNTFRGEAVAEIASLAVIATIVSSDRSEPAIRESAGRMLNELLALESRRPSAFRRQRYFLLSLSAVPHVQVAYRPVPSLLPLRPDRLKELAETPELARVRDHLLAAAATLRGEDRRLPTAANALSRIDALYKFGDAWDASEFYPDPQADPAIAELLRGHDPEFRAPVLYSLRDEFADEEGQKAMVRIFREVFSDIELNDVRGEAFAVAMMQNPERALAAPVELADRARRTRDLLDAACDARPDSERLARVRDAYRRWDDAVDSLLISYFVRLDPSPR